MPRLLILLLMLALSPTSVMAKKITWQGEGDVRTQLGFLHYRTAGRGQPLLLLHGYFGEGRQWQKYLDEFAVHFTVIAPDLPGHGESLNSADNFDPVTVAAAMWELVDQLGYGKLSGVGYSAGGMTLLAMAAQQPERVHAMVLAASAHRVIPSEPQTWDELPAAFKADMLRNHPRGVKQVEKLLGTHLIPDISPERLRGLRVPALFVVGDSDASFPVPVVNETHELLEHGKLWIIPKVGHPLFWTEWGGDRKLEREFPVRVLDFIAEPY